MIRAGASWSIARRLGTGFAVLLLLLASLVALIAWQLAENDRSGEHIQSAIARTQGIDEFERALLLFAVSTRDTVMERSTEQLQNFAATERRLEQAVRGVESATGTGSLAPLVTRYVVAAHAAVAKGEMVPATLIGQREALLTRARSMLQQQDEMLSATLERMRMNRRAASATLLLGTAVTGLLALGIILVTIRSVREPAVQLVEVATAMREGNWGPASRLGRAHAQAPRATANEMSQIGHAFGAAARELELREHLLAAHAAIAQAAGSSLDAARIGDGVLRAVLGQVGAEVGALYVLDAETRTLLPLAARCASQAPGPVAWGEGLVGQCAQDGKALVWSGIPPDAPFEVRLGHDQSAPHSAAAIPVIFNSEVIGVLAIASLRPLEAGALAFLDAAATQVGVGLANARAYADVQRLLERVRAQGEEIQAQNEELQAQGEEIQAQNEQLQAQNEELQAQGEEIQAQNDDLQRQSAQLHEQATILRDSDARKNEFLGVLAHELRNPLAPIANCVQLLARGGTAVKSDKVEKILARQVRHMTHLIDDLLDITRISHGKVVLKRERLDVINVVNHCLEDQREALLQQGIALSLDLPDVPVYVEGDHTRLCQVFSNLLINAIKFCQPGATVSVRVTLDAPGRRVAVHVKDGGEGIEPHLLARIFEPFYQVEGGLARTRGGLGLGLALARGLVDLHGGQIHAHSKGRGEGAEFVVSLPLAHAAEQPVGRAAPAPAESPAHRPLSTRVLVIDDNVDAASTLAEVLAMEGCQVETAFTARDGIDAAQRLLPDVILCDVGLPDMDGYAAARELRAHPDLGTTLLVAITGYSAPADQARAALAGFDVHVSKPPDLDRLLELLRNPAAALRQQA